MPFHGWQIHSQVSVHAAGEAALQLVALLGHQGGAETLIGRSSPQCQLGKQSDATVKPQIKNLTLEKNLIMKYLQQKLHAQPIRGTAEGSFHRQHLVVRIHTHTK